MYYKTFEDDANPGVFKEDGWVWLDRVIKLSKEAGLKVFLDMHAPQGGYQSDKAQGFSAFWGTSATDVNTSLKNFFIQYFLAQPASPSAKAAQTVSPITHKSSRMDIPLIIHSEDKSVILRSESDILSCIVYDLSGRVIPVQSSLASGGVMRLTLPSQGLFVLQISTPEGNQVRKVVVR